jgi:hypothetical protein
MTLFLLFERAESAAALLLRTFPLPCQVANGALLWRSKLKLRLKLHANNARRFKGNIFGKINGLVQKKNYLRERERERERVEREREREREREDREREEMGDSFSPCIAVHIGGITILSPRLFFLTQTFKAGVFSKAKPRLKQFESTLREALVAGIESLRASTPSSLSDSSPQAQILAVQAVLNAIKSLEKDPSTNSGTGSNLTLTQTVECDASMSLNHVHFGAVGAVSRLLYPIEGAKAVMMWYLKNRPSCISCIYSMV